MSSPATAGVVALMLEANPELTPADVRSILESTAREDDDTGVIPAEGDHVWGHGKVTASQAVLKALTWDSTLGTSDLHLDQTFVYPNPTSNHLWFIGLSPSESTWEIFDIDGRSCDSGSSSNLSSIDVSGLPIGMYIVQVLNDGSAEEFKFLKR